MISDSRIIVGVLRGGPSSEHEVSLQTGANILNSLPAKYESRDINIAKDGVWHLQGYSRMPDKVLKTVDVVWNALHGEYGEDGKVQQILESFSIPYTGSRVMASAMAMNKAMAKQRLSDHGIKTPKHVLIRAGRGDLNEIIMQTFRSMPLPFVVKPLSLGSSVGLSIARDHFGLESAIRRAITHSAAVLVEEYIAGKEATCGVVDHFRGEEVYSLLPIEIRLPAHKELFDYEAKYSGISEEICPGNFTPLESREIQRLAALAHKILGLRHYSRSDFIVTPKRGIYFLEANTLPGFTKESLFPKALRAVGSDIPEFIDHVISLALSRK